MTSSIHISKGRASMRSSSKRANQHTLYGTMIVKVIFESISCSSAGNYLLVSSRSDFGWRRVQ